MNDTPQPDAVDQGLTDPASQQVDGQTTVAKPIPDLVQGANRQAGIQALAGSNRRGGLKSAWGACRPAKAIPPGTSYDDDHEGLHG